jgi:hypothetical protein
MRHDKIIFFHVSNALHFLYCINVKLSTNIMPRVTLRVDPRTKQARVIKPLTMTITMKKPHLKAKVFPPRRPSKSYKRKKPNIPMPLQPKIQFSAAFAKKNIQYVAMIMCHGSSCDSIHRCKNPTFETKYDLIWSSPHGTSTTTHGPPHEVYHHLCNVVNSRTNADTPLTGKSFMTALNSTINLHDLFDLGKLHKTAALKQRDQGSNVSDLNIFMSGLHSPTRIDGIYLFEVGKPCGPSQHHNAMTVDPARLVQTHPDLFHVAQTAMNLQSFIEPTTFHGVRHPHSTLQQHDTAVTKDWMGVQYQLKENQDNVRLSDVVGKEGIFPPNTVVIAYVCRMVDSLPKQSYDSPVTSDYTSTSTSSMSESHTSDDGADVSGLKPDSSINASLHDDEMNDDDLDAFLNLLGGAVKHGKSLKKRRR